MSRKLLSTSIIFVLIMGFLPSINSLNNNQGLTNENYENNRMEDNLFFLEYPIMDYKLEYPDDKGVPYPILDDLPNQFSWKNHNGKDWTTPAKHQGPCGSCWAFAALGVLESIVKIREGNSELNPDFSEQYLLSCLPKAGGCRGGKAWVVFKLLQDETSQGNNANGTIFEQCFPYQADDDIPCSDKCTNWRDQLVPILDWGYWDSNGTAQGRKAIKSYVFENGPVVTHMRVTNWFKLFGSIIHNSFFYYPKFRPVYFENHVVMIVGWKDIPIIPSGGYWICKNSWGTEWGYDGFFNIAYGSLNIDRSLIVWADYDPESYNWPPVADAGGPYEDNIGNQVTFDASGSIGYEGEIIDYSWDFGDGTYGSGINPNHTYLKSGKYTVILTVTDIKNSISSDKISVFIS